MILLLPILAALGLMSYLGLPIIETSLAFVFGALAWVLSLILYPFDLLIKTTMPALHDGLGSLQSMFDIAMTYMSYIIDASLIPQTAITLLVSYYVFVGGITFAAWGFKLIIKWKQAIF